MEGRFLVAVAILVTDGERILIGKRAMGKDVAPGLWEYPSGRLEQGESPEDAVRREGREELGVEVIPQIPVHSYFFYRGDVPSILIAYTATISGTPVRSEEHSELRWVNIDDANSYFEIAGLKEITNRLVKLKNMDCIE